MPLMSVLEAQRRILEQAAPRDAVAAPLSDALGMFLAGDVTSDIDSPPFDKALMDGYAVRSSDCQTGDAVLSVIEEVTAGRVPTRAVQTGEATRIMTGAPLPEGADAVVRLEDTELDEPSGAVRIRVSVSAGGSVLRRGASLRCGQILLTTGQELRAQQLGALAEIGHSRVWVRPRPQVAILATGDELVPVGQRPGPGQIRNSNETMLVGQATQAGAVPVPLGIARDNRPDLRAAIQRGLTADLLLLTGGVSAGKLDLVPSELQEAGVRCIFHKVDLKPGKPVWFGIYDAPQQTGLNEADLRVSASGRCLVFGLPGNPVSSLVCFELFVRPALRRLLGAVNPAPPTIRGRLAQPHVARGDRPTYHPARMTWGENGALIEPVPWHGSADLCATRNANGMVYFAAGEYRLGPGAPVDFHPW